jgi:hypothetical protein
MLWGYVHQHVGALNGTLKVNGKPICTSKPIYGTDPAKPAGNEKGYVVNFTRCIDNDNLHNKLRLNKVSIISSDIGSKWNNWSRFLQLLITDCCLTLSALGS